MSNSKSVCVVAAKRTAIGKFMGSLSNVAAIDLGAHVIKAVCDEAGIKTEHVDQVIMGQVLTAATGQNPARQASIKAGVPIASPAYTINQVCGSGLRAIAEGFKAIQLGESEIIVAGGQENMSLSPHATAIRAGQKMGNAPLEDTMIVDGLWDAFNDYHMGITAENVAEKFGIDRSSQDEFAAHSQQKAAAAQEAGYFNNEITPFEITTRKGSIVFDQDEFIRPGTQASDLAKLKPAFKRDGGTVTAGNASGINDGAAAVLLMTETKAAELGLTPLATIKTWATIGVDPTIMGSGPIPASQKALEKAGWKVDDLDLIEANEAFAAQACAVNQEMGWPEDKVNVHGGAIALGHPIGASGARVLVTLLHGMQRLNVQKGLATLCIGGGMGIVMCVER